jgi:hypothetical protein
MLGAMIKRLESCLNPVTQHYTLQIMNLLNKNLPLGYEVKAQTQLIRCIDSAIIPEK